MADTALIQFDIIVESDETHAILSNPQLSCGAKGVYLVLIRMERASVRFLASLSTNSCDEVAGFLKELKKLEYIKIKSKPIGDNIDIWTVICSRGLNFVPQSQNPSSSSFPLLSLSPFPLCPLPSSSLEPSISYPPISPFPHTQTTPNHHHQPCTQNRSKNLICQEKSEEKDSTLVNEKKEEKESDFANRIADNVVRQVSSRIQSLKTNAFRNGHSFGGEKMKNLEFFDKSEYNTIESQVKEFMDEWNSNGRLRKMVSVHGRAERIRFYMNDKYYRDNYKEAIKRMSESDFLCGKNKSGWVADVGWFLTSENFDKIMKGRFDNWDKRPKEESDVIKLLPIKKEYTTDVIPSPRTGKKYDKDTI